MKKLYLMRGLPGSGKSTLAREIAGLPHGAVISTDDYFMAGDKYLFDPSEIGQAHAWNQRRCKKLMKAETPIIVIDNTNVCLWEMREYVVMAQEHGYEIHFFEPATMWKNHPETCAAKNKHGVPLHAIKGMQARWEMLPSFFDDDVALNYNDRDVDAVLASVSPFAKKRA